MVEELFSIRPMSKEDIPFGLSLGEASGWNQVFDDWLRIFRYQPAGCFVAMCGDQRVGTITTTSYGTDLAWIGMMLVHADFRRRGYATALMQHALQWLNDQGVSCIKLDATPEGAKVYESLGFEREWDFHRWMKPGTEVMPRPALVAEPLPFNVPSRDLKAFGVDRQRWLGMLATDSKVSVKEQSFGMLRTGRLADYFGPVIAETKTAAEAIVSELLASTERTVFWDVPGPNVAASRLAEKFGFEITRPLTRMWVGDQLIKGNTDFQYALASPATG